MEDASTVKRKGVPELQEAVRKGEASVASLISPALRSAWQFDFRGVIDCLLAKLGTPS